MKRDEGTIEKESCYYRMLKKKKKRLLEKGKKGYLIIEKGGVVVHSMRDKALS